MWTSLKRLPSPTVLIEHSSLRGLVDTYYKYGVSRTVEWHTYLRATRLPASLSSYVDRSDLLNSLGTFGLRYTGRDAQLTPEMLPVHYETES